MPSKFDEATKSISKGNVKIHLITTDKKIKPLEASDAFKLAEIFEKDGQSSVGHAFFDAGVCNKCVTFTEWKTPDDASVPSLLEFNLDNKGKGVKYRFVTDFLPPYKDQK